MGRLYAVNITNQTLTGAKTIIQVKAGAANSLRIVRASIIQIGSTTSTQFVAELVRKSTAATVTSFTPLLLTPADSAAAAVGGTAATGTLSTNENSGDGDILWQDGGNIVGQWLWYPGKGIPEILVPGGGIIGLKVVSGTITNGYGSLIFEEDP